MDLAATQPAPRVIGRGAAIALVLGNMVGVGIFLTPGEVARAAPDVASYLALWVLGGVMALAGAEVTAELGSMFPQAGGDYVFLDRAFGRSIARAWGLLAALLSFPGSVATLAVGAVDTLATVLGGLATQLIPGYPFTFKDILALAVVFLVTEFNRRGVTMANRIQAVLTWTPILVFVCIAVAMLLLGTPDESGPGLHEHTKGSSLAAAFCAVFFTFSGWNVLTYVGGEVKAPGRTIPMAMLAAVVLATIAYLVLNIAFLVAIPITILPEVPNAGVAMAERLFGEVGKDAFAVVMTMAILAGLNSTVMASARITYAVARDGYLWHKCADLSPRHKTPSVALFVQAVLASVLVLTGSFSFLVTATGAVIMLLSCVTIASIFVFRTRMKLRPPMDLLGYPWTAILFLAVGLMVAVSAFVSSGPWPVVGLVLAVLLAAGPKLACLSQGGLPKKDAARLPGGMEAPQVPGARHEGGESP